MDQSSGQRKRPGKSKARFFYAFVVFAVLGLPLLVFLLLFMKYLWPHMKH